ncbi:MAG: RRXRR domain-containing protein, partial [Methanobrevibacter sp.]|nr:RRXRR domain-containing protein [Methanobrevibacter sp.]
MYVYCINANGEPLNQIHPAEARKLLKTGDWHVKSTIPFTIKENYIENCSQIG